MAKKEWKKGFLSSGFPLEFETAKVLVKNGFTFEPDYCYERIEAGQAKDFLVDLSGSLFFPTSNPDKVTADLQVLIECKYRTPNKTCVFLPDVNSPELALWHGSTIRAFDNFSFCEVSDKPIYAFDSNIPLCYKGTEIDLANGNAHDSEIRHGINQLQYALPRLITEEILFQVQEDPEEVIPFFVLPILVTTAKLRVLKKGTTLAKVDQTHILEAITNEVPYLILFNSSGPDFVDHATRQFKRLASIKYYDNVEKIENRLSKSGIEFYKFRLPSFICKELAEGNRYRLNDYCSQFLICSFDSLPELLSKAKQAIRASLRGKKSF